MSNNLLAHLFRCGLTLISPKLNTCLTYRIKFKRSIDFEHPRYFNEKLLVLKLRDYVGNDLIKQCADKYAVREYVEKCGCSEILNRLIAAYDNPEDIDFEALPDSFAIKWNYGCGLNIICSDKSKLDIKKTVETLKKMKKVNAYLPYSEVQYKNVKKKIIIEEYLSDGSGNLPLDYKIYCFNGIPKCVMLCIGREKGHPKFYYFDRNWNFMRIGVDGRTAPDDFYVAKPDGIDEAFDYAEKLSKPFKFVRADFYLCYGKPIFGELTFTPSGSMDNSMPETEDSLFGKWLEI